MKKAVRMFLGMLAVFSILSCNDGMMSAGGNDTGKQTKRDRSQRTVIDATEYIDFTISKNNPASVRKEDVLNILGGYTFKNGNSKISIKAMEGTVEITSDRGRYNGKENCQIFGIFALEVKAASSDCLYIRKDPSKEGFLMVDGVMFRNEAMPDLAVCLPLYGYSRNRIEVSPVMDGYIVMPSGTYWK